MLSNSEIELATLDQDFDSGHCFTTEKQVGDIKMAGFLFQFEMKEFKETFFKFKYSKIQTADKSLPGLQQRYPWLSKPWARDILGFHSS